MDTPHDDVEAQIIQQLPVISSQRESLAARGRARLEAAHRRGRATWSLSWHTAMRQAKTLTAATLAELYVGLLAQMTGEERTRWAGDQEPHGTGTGA